MRCVTLVPELVVTDERGVKARATDGVPIGEHLVVHRWDGEWQVTHRPTGRWIDRVRDGRLAVAIAQGLERCDVDLAGLDDRAVNEIRTAATRARWTAIEETVR